MRPLTAAEVDWQIREFLGWRDPRAPNRAYLVTERDGRALGIEVRATTDTGPRRGSALCDVCHTATPPTASAGRLPGSGAQGVTPPARYPRIAGRILATTSSSAAEAIGSTRTT